MAFDPTGILGKSSLKASRYRFVVDEEEVVLGAVEGTEASDTDPASWASCSDIITSISSVDIVSYDGNVLVVLIRRWWAGINLFTYSISIIAVG